MPKELSKRARSNIRKGLAVLEIGDCAGTCRVRQEDCLSSVLPPPADETVLPLHPDLHLIEGDLSRLLPQTSYFQEVNASSLLLPIPSFNVEPGPEAVNSHPKPGSKQPNAADQVMGTTQLDLEVKENLFQPRPELELLDAHSRHISELNLAQNVADTTQQQDLAKENLDTMECLSSNPVLLPAWNIETEKTVERCSNSTASPYSLSAPPINSPITCVEQSLDSVDMSTLLKGWEEQEKERENNLSIDNGFESETLFEIETEPEIEIETVPAFLRSFLKKPSKDISPGDVPLYEETSTPSKISSHDFMIALITFASTAHLSGKSTYDLISLLEIVLPQPNNLPKSAYLFKQYFKDNDGQVNMVFFCTNCWRTRASMQDLCSECDSPKRKVSYFISCSLETQLQRLYNRPGFFKKLQYKFIRRKSNEDNIEDLYDGKIYKEAEKTILSDPKSISLMFYTDGAAVFECSTFQLWPCIFTINELPPQDRHKVENILIGGIWGGDCKPHPNIFLLPTYHDLEKLRIGIEVNLHGSSSPMLIQCFLLYGTCDSPAKAAFMNMKCCSGYYSCGKCCIKGEKSKRTGMVMVFPHVDVLNNRTEEDYQNCVLEGVKSSDGCKGIFGPTLLSYMFSTSVISGMGTDVMHCVYMGIMKQLLKLWFDPKHKDKRFCIVDKIPEVNARLNKLNLPHFVQRGLLEVDKSLSYWKATLCRNFFFYIGPLILRGLLPDDLYENYCLLVKGVALLNTTSISMDDLDLADECLLNFCKKFQSYYGYRNMSFNLHLLRHLKQTVLDSGPLGYTHCFEFEDLIGKIVDLVHGTRYVIQQISSKLNILTELPLLISSIVSEPIKNYCKNMTRQNKNFSTNVKIATDLYVVGEFGDMSCHSNVVLELVTVLCSENTRPLYFERLYKNRQLFVSSSYTRGSRISSYCRYSVELNLYHGNILTFVMFQDRYFALVDRSYDLPIGIDRFCQFVSSGDVDLIPVTSLINVSFCLELEDGKFCLVDPLNNIENE